MRYNVDIVVSLGVLLCFLGLGLTVEAYATKHPCPASQPGLILRDLEHPPIHPRDSEWVVYGDGGILKVGLNQVQAEGLAYQLNEMFGKSTFAARQQIRVEPPPSEQGTKPGEAK